MSSDEEVQAVIIKICIDGEKVPYIVTVNQEIGFITFTLNSTVWQEDTIPEHREVVILSKLRKRNEGWRAKSARRFRPCDEKTAEEKS